MTENKLQISSDSFTAIQKASSGKSSSKSQPVYLQVVCVEGAEDQFLIYANILNQVLVFSRLYSDVALGQSDSEKEVFPAKFQKIGLSPQVPVDPVQQITIPGSYSQQFTQQQKDFDEKDERENSAHANNMVHNLLDDESDSDGKETIARELSLLEDQVKI